MDFRNRKKQIEAMCNWLAADFEGKQNRLGKALDISQSMISGYFSQDFEDYADPKDQIKERFVDYLLYKAPRNKRCDRWTVAVFTEYMDSDLDPQAFSEWIKSRPVKVRQPVEDVYSSLSQAEKLKFFEFYLEEQKKNCVLFVKNYLLQEP